MGHEGVARFELRCLEPTRMTGKPLFSSHWYRVGHLRPRLQPGISTQRQVVRMQEWFILTQPISGRHHRLNRIAYEFVARLDGEQSVDAIWNGLQEKLGDGAPTQDETIATLAQLTEAGLLFFDALPDLPTLQKANDAKLAQ